MKFGTFRHEESECESFKAHILLVSKKLTVYFNELKNRKFWIYFKHWTTCRSDFFFFQSKPNTNFFFQCMCSQQFTFFFLIKNYISMEEKHAHTISVLAYKSRHCIKDTESVWVGYRGYRECLSWRLWYFEIISC